MDNTFNPRDENTFKYAKENVITVIDGTPIFYTIEDKDGEHKIFISQTDYVKNINDAWEINKTSYQDKQECINLIIKSFLICCSDYSIKMSDLTINGYTYSIAMKEMAKYLSQEDLIKLTEIIKNHFENKRQKHRLKQEIFDKGIHIDNYLFADLCYATDLEQEQEIMYEYYNCYEDFESETELDNLLDNEYLNLYPDLKKEVRENLINRIN